MLQTGLSVIRISQVARKGGVTNGVSRKKLRSEEAADADLTTF